MRYEPAAKNPLATGCQTGTRALALAVKTVYPELYSLTAVYGCYARRRARDAPTWSLHAEGRAFDTGVPGRENETGWLLACDLVNQRTVYGVQRVIWDGHIWSIEQPAGWRPLQPTSHQHHDHVHTEQYRRDAAKPLSVRAEYERALYAGRAKHPAVS